MVVTKIKQIDVKCKGGLSWRAREGYKLQAASFFIYGLNSPGMNAGE
jgi:hypothetical protein